jgi:hypothetical protein
MTVTHRGSARAPRPRFCQSPNVHLLDGDLWEPLLVEPSAGAVFDADFDHAGYTGAVEVSP